MTLVLNQNLRWLVCFLAGLVSAFLLSFGLSFGQFALSATSLFGNQSANSPLISTFDEVAASHLESNFYH
jgi:hypothetical protein